MGVFNLPEQDPTEIELFEFTLPGVYEQKVDKFGRLVFEGFKDELEEDGKAVGQPVYDEDTPVVYSKTLHVYRLPKMQFLGVEQVEVVEGGGSLAEVLSIFGPAADAIRHLNGKQMGVLMKAWRDGSATDLGE